MVWEITALDCSRPVQAWLQPSTCQGIVHSVFQRAINLALDDTLIALLSAELPHMPNGIQLPTESFVLLATRVKPGMSVRIENGDIFIATHSKSTSFRLTCPDRPPWEPRPSVALCRWRRSCVAEHVSRLVDAFAAALPLDGLAPALGVLLHREAERSVRKTPLLRVALPSLRQLASAAWCQDRVMLAMAVSRLAGLGPGLTPSGDDALGGFAAVMALLSPYLSLDGSERAWIAKLIVQEAGARTTLLSKVLLEYAALGEVAEPVGTLLTALALPLAEHQTVRLAMQRVLALGATSGADTLLGIVLALHVLEGGFADDIYGE